MRRFKLQVRSYERMGMSTFDEMVDFVKSAWPARGFIVPCLEGPAGIGKTAAIKQAANELKDDGLATGKVVTIIASQILPNEVSGITMPVVESKAMEIFDHFRLSSLEDGDILFFDELLEADQLVLSACLTLIESRELMSGHKLPDAMIVAATNPTIKPNMLKENIRQRFVWRKFEIDERGCREYIKETYGFDIGPELARAIRCSGEEYNILSPRSMTKMAAWIASAKDRDEAWNIAANIDAAWEGALGTQLMKAAFPLRKTAKQQAREAIRDALVAEGYSCDEIVEKLGSKSGAIASDVLFEETSITELMEMLQALPEWETIADRLASLEMSEDGEEEMEKVTF